MEEQDYDSDIDIDNDIDIDSDIDIDNDNVYINDINIKDEFIIVFKNLVESIGKITDIDIDMENVDMYINGETVKLKIDDESNIILKTDDYEIIDIEKIIEFEFSNLDAIIEATLKQDLYPDIEIITEEVKKKVYSEVEKKESFQSIPPSSQKKKKRKFHQTFKLGDQ